MRTHSPWGPSPLALERTVLKLRAMEMVLILYYVEDLKRQVVSAIRNTDSLLKYKSREERIPEGTSKVYKKAWAALVEDGVITHEESKEIRKLIDYRNAIAHAMHDVTGDVSTDPVVMGIVENSGSRYNSEALDRVRQLRKKVLGRLSKVYVVTLGSDNLLFSAAQQTYEDELTRLKKRVRVLANRRNAKISRANKRIRSVGADVWKDLSIRHYEFRKANGSLTKKGVACFERLVEFGLGELALAHTMRMSLRAVRARLEKMTNVKQVSDGDKTLR